jgi:G3E family GTPase
MENIRTDNSKVIELLQNQLKEKDQEIERLKGLFEKCYNSGRSYEWHRCNTIQNPIPTFEQWSKENNIAPSKDGN